MEARPGYEICVYFHFVLYNYRIWFLWIFVKIILNSAVNRSVWLLVLMQRILCQNPIRMCLIVWEKMICLHCHCIWTWMLRSHGLRYEEFAGDLPTFDQLCHEWHRRVWRVHRRRDYIQRHLGGASVNDPAILRSPEWCEAGHQPIEEWVCVCYCDIFRACCRPGSD